jgi:hypothetical protein
MSLMDDGQLNDDHQLLVVVVSQTCSSPIALMLPFVRYHPRGDKGDSGGGGDQVRQVTGLREATHTSQARVREFGEKQEPNARKRLLLLISCRLLTCISCNRFSTADASHVRISLSLNSLTESLIVDVWLPLTAVYHLILLTTHHQNYDDVHAGIARLIGKLVMM